MDQQKQESSQQNNEEQKEVDNQINLNKELIKACKENDEKKVIELIKKGASAKYEFKEEGVWGAYEQYSSIHQALIQKNHTIIKLLLENGANVNAIQGSQNWKGSGVRKSAFQMSLDQQDTEICILFLKYGADPNQKTVSEQHTMRYDGRTQQYPIHSAANKNNFELLKALINAGAKVDEFYHNEGHSEYGDHKLLKQTALHILCQQKYYKQQLDAAQLLLKNGANINQIKVQNIQVEKQVQSEICDPRDEGYEPRVENIREESTCLHLALQNENIKLISLLIEFGINRNINKKNGSQILQLQDLCNKKEVLNFINLRWEPSLFIYYPQRIKQCILTLMLSVIKKKFLIRKEIIFIIIDYYVGISFVNIK